MKLFRSFRWFAVSGKNVSKYLAYAVGEIILVVIGILIAVSINNHNEEQKANRQLLSMLRTYQQDLKMDTTVVGANIRMMVEKQKVFKICLSDTVTAQDYMNNPMSFGLVMMYSPFEFQNKGYQMLQNYADGQNKEPDSLVVKLLAVHIGYKKLVDQIQERISEDVTDNIMYFKNNQPWTADLFLGKIDNPTIMQYFLSDDYRSRLAVHNQLANGNLLVILQQYQKQSKEILQELNKRLTAI